MIQQNKQRYFIPCLSIVALLFTIILTKTSCKKIDALINEDVKNKIVNTKKFFDLPANVNSTVARVANALAQQNEKTGFINELANTAGYPVWGKSTVKLIKGNTTTTSNSLLEDYEGGDTCILIPMVLEDGVYVNAFISAVIINDSVTMRLYYKNDYKAYPFKSTQPTTGVTTAEEFASQMMLFDKEVFDYSIFQVKDKRLFNNSTNYTDTANITRTVKLISSTTSGTNNLIPACVELEFEITNCSSSFSLSSSNFQNNSGSNTQACTTVIVTVTICGNSGGGSGPIGWPSGGGGSGPGGPGGPGGGGGGTGGGNPPGNCQVGGLIENGFALPNPCNPGGGNPLPPIPNNVIFLKNTLNLSVAQVDWLIQNISRANEIFNYLELDGSPLRIQIAKDHLNLMINNANYLTFMQAHWQNGNPNIIWWEDSIWLRQIEFQMPNEEIYNFYFEASKPENPKPFAEFSDKCEGIKYITNLSIGDGKERSGYITLDNKFIYTNNGSSTVTNLNIRIRNNQLYYNYKVSKGAPSLNYAGMFIDPQRNEYWIPLKVNIHNHILGSNSAEVPITPYDLSKSDGDGITAKLLQQNPNADFRLFVIEAKQNGKYLNASYDKYNPNYTIINDDITFNEICDGIY